MRNAHCRTWNMARKNDKGGIREIQQDPDFGEKTEKRGK